MAVLVAPANHHTTSAAFEVLKCHAHKQMVVSQCVRHCVSPAFMQDQSQTSKKCLATRAHAITRIHQDIIWQPKDRVIVQPKGIRDKPRRHIFQRLLKDYALKINTGADEMRRQCLLSEAA